MTDIPLLLNDKKAIFLELDDVIFPKKDYDLQVYYLFAQFLEMTGGHSAAEIVEFFKEQNRLDSDEAVFEKFVQKFAFVSKYRPNFETLYKTARLPLRLFVFQKMLNFLNLAIKNGVQIFVVTSGDPETQLNKIKQINWQGMEQYVKVFFTEELGQTFYSAVAKLLLDHNFLAADTLTICKNKLVYPPSNSLNLPYVLVTEINTTHGEQ
ncbi:FMN phosphatase YigB (HAD superfamily) [Pedobacter sp. UYEF25]